MSLIFFTVAFAACLSVGEAVEKATAPRYNSKRWHAKQSQK